MKPGEYILEIDTNRAGLNLIPDHKTPITVIIKSGETSNIRIGVVESAVIEGQVTLYAAPEKLQRLLTPSDTIDRGEYREEDLVIDSGYSKVLIEIRMHGETKRTLSDHKGFFTFYDVRPGLWTLEASKTSLPADHYYNEDLYTIDVRPDETNKLDIKIFPHKRPLTSIQEGGLLILEKPEDGPTGEKADYIATLSDEEYQKVTDTLERIKLSSRKHIPKLLGLDWAISYDAAEMVLLEKEKNFEILSHVSALTLLDTRSIEAAEIHDLESLPIVEYFSRGINHYNLSGLTILSFYNPLKHQDHLYLLKVEIHLTAEDKHGEAVDIESVFNELGHLFVAKWGITMDDAANFQAFRI